MDYNQSLRNMPRVDDLLNTVQAKETAARFGRKAALEGIRAALRQVRRNTLDTGASIPTADQILSEAARLAEAAAKPSLVPVINATGIILHTNLGRAVLGREVAEAVYAAAVNYSNLEYDLAAGSRGSRHQHVERLLGEVCGAEAAMAVNNNAAAVLLALSALARGREVVVSRGELVEIGGSFRVPEIMAESGALLKEVGTTNKTRPADYQNAISDSTGAILKVHTSNYRILGFTEETSLEELAVIAAQRQLPLLYDMGSGAMFPLDGLGVSGEPDVPSCLKQGADVICFSGDKLLGGPQAGLIVGKRAYIARMKQHPLARAFRIDKLTAAALEATLRLYQDLERAKTAVPTLRMLGQSRDVLKARAQALTNRLIQENIQVEPMEDTTEVGGGSAPTVRIPTWTVRIMDDRLRPDRLAESFRLWKIPVIGRVGKDRFLLDMMTVNDDQLNSIAEAAVEIFQRAGTKPIETRKVLKGGEAE